MKVAYVIDSDTHDTAFSYVLDLAKGMKRIGHEPLLFLPRGSIFYNVCVKENVAARRILFSSFIPFSTMFMSEAVNKNGIDIIHATSLNGLSAAVRATEITKRKGVKTVFTPIEFDYHIDSNLVKSIINTVGAIIMPSHISTEYTSKITAKIYYKKFAVPPISKTGPKLFDQPTVMVNGRITSGKRLDALFEAASLIDRNDFRIVIIGEGSSSIVMPLKQATRRFGIEDRVEWLGRRLNYRDIISDATVAVELTNYEELLRIAEYVAAGIPVIASGETAKDQYITDNKNGLLLSYTKAPDKTFAEQLADALRTALYDADFRNRFEEYRAQHLPAPYSNHAQEIAAIYSSIL